MISLFLHLSGGRLSDIHLNIFTATILLLFTFSLVLIFYFISYRLLTQELQIYAILNFMHLLVDLVQLDGKEGMRCFIYHCVYVFFEMDEREKCILRKQFQELMCLTQMFLE